MDRVALLDAIARQPASGEELALRFGVSRAAVWKAIEALRAEGLGIDGRRGYRLVDPRGFGRITLSWRCGRPVRYFQEVDSTNRVAREAAICGESPIVVADRQTAGRGRQGRRWESPAGMNLLFSIVMRPHLAPQLAPRAVLGLAAVMAEVLGVWLKWPNDLVDLDGRKLGGVLAEMESAGEWVRHIVLGVGINVNQERFPEHLPEATSLRRLRGQEIDRAELLGRLVRAIDAVDVEDPALLDRWRARSRTIGRRVRVNTLGGPVEGVATGVRDDGALLVSGRPVLAGDVELV